VTLSAIIVIVINSLLALVLALVAVPILVWMERRIASFIQDRLGPNRCNIAGIRLAGIIQSFADMLKLVFKEDFTPGHVKHKTLFVVAPTIIFVCSFLTFGVIPFADDLVIGSESFKMQALPIDLGVLWILAFTGLSVYSILLAGLASHNKYSLLGAVRSASQMISYEAAMGLSLISMLVVYGSVDLADIARF